VDAFTLRTVNERTDGRRGSQNPSEIIYSRSPERVDKGSGHGPVYEDRFITSDERDGTVDGVLE